MWVKVDDAFPAHPVALAIGPLGRDLHLAALCYSSRYETDGFLPAAAVPMLCNPEGLAEPAAIVARLVASGAWEEVPGGYRLVLLGEHQPTAEQRAAWRSGNVARQQRFRDRRRDSRSLDEALGVVKAAETRNAVRNGVTHASRNGAVTPYPDPVPVTPSPPQGTSYPSEGSPPPRAEKRAPKPKTEPKPPRPPAAIADFVAQLADLPGFRPNASFYGKVMERYHGKLDLERSAWGIVDWSARNPRQPISTMRVLKFLASDLDRLEEHRARLSPRPPTRLPSRGAPAPAAPDLPVFDIGQWRQA